MKKIPTIFIRNPDNLSELLDEPHPDCEWVFKGEGVATQKYDGTCVKIENQKYYKRREVKKGKPIPHGFIEEDFDAITGKKVGWLEIEPADTANKWHMEAKEFHDATQTFQTLKDEDGTYELLGPKIEGNPEMHGHHILVKHSLAKQVLDAPREFEELRNWLDDKDIEGLVFHHPDGRMGKIKKRDFKLKRIYKVP